MQRDLPNKAECVSADQRLRLYALTAAAAGVSMLAMALPAEGSVVITRKTIQVPLNGTVSVDLNNDGLADFEFSLTSSFANSRRQDNLTAKGLTGGKVIGRKLKPSSAPYAIRMHRRWRAGTRSDRPHIFRVLTERSPSNARRMPNLPVPTTETGTRSGPTTFLESSSRSKARRITDGFA